MGMTLMDIKVMVRCKSSVLVPGAPHHFTLMATAPTCCPFVIKTSFLADNSVNSALREAG